MFFLFRQTFGLIAKRRLPKLTPKVAFQRKGIRILWKPTVIGLDATNLTNIKSCSWRWDCNERTSTWFVKVWDVKVAALSMQGSYLRKETLLHRLWILWKQQNRQQACIKIKSRFYIEVCEWHSFKLFEQTVCDGMMNCRLQTIKTLQCLSITLQFL